MSLRRKPHSVTVAKPEDILEANVIRNHADGPAVALAGMVVPVDSGTMADKYGVDTRRGFLFIGDPEAGDAFAEGGRLYWDGRAFAVKGAPLVFKGFGAADNCSAPLEELDLADLGDD